MVSNKIRHIEINLENSRESLSYPIKSPGEVESAIKMTHSIKAGGDDEIVYEHIKYKDIILLENSLKVLLFCDLHMLQKI